MKEFKNTMQEKKWRRAKSLISCGFNLLGVLAIIAAGILAIWLFPW